MLHKLSHRTIAAKNQSLIILGFLVTFIEIFSFINVFDANYSVLQRTLMDFFNNVSI